RASFDHQSRSIAVAIMLNDPPMGAIPISMGELPRALRTFAARASALALSPVTFASTIVVAISLSSISVGADSPTTLLLYHSRGLLSSIYSAGLPLSDSVVFADSTVMPPPLRPVITIRFILIALH